MLTKGYVPLTVHTLCLKGCLNIPSNCSQGKVLGYASADSSRTARMAVSTSSSVLNEKLKRTAPAVWCRAPRASAARSARGSGRDAVSVNNASETSGRIVVADVQRNNGSALVLRKVSVDHYARNVPHGFIKPTHQKPFPRINFLHARCQKKVQRRVKPRCRGCSAYLPPGAWDTPAAGLS